MYIYILGVARYMYSYRTVTVRASRFGAWGLTMSTGNSPPIQKGAPAVMQHCLITASRRTANAMSCALETKPPESDHVLILNVSLTYSRLTKKYTLKACTLTKWSFVLVYPTSLIQHKSKYSIIFPYLRCNVSECSECVCVCMWRDHFNCFLIPAKSTLNTYRLNNASLYKGLLLFVYTHKENK